MADVEENEKKKDKPEDKSEDKASTKLADEANPAPPKRPEDDAKDKNPSSTTAVDSNGKPKKGLDGQSEDDKKKDGDKDKTKPGEAKAGDGKAGEAKAGPPKGEKVSEAKGDPEKLQKKPDGTFTSSKEFPPGSEVSKTEKHLDAKKKLIDETTFNSDGSKITSSADKQSIKTVSATGEEANYKLDKNGKLTSYSDSEGSWSKQTDGSWKNENTGKTFEGEKWVDEKGALHSKSKTGEHESKQIDGSKTKFDSQDRPEQITDKLGGKTTLGYKGDEKQPSSVDYGQGKWEATDADKTKWEKTLPNGTKQNWEGSVKVENGKVTDVYKNGTEVQHNSDGSTITTDKNKDLNEISAGNQKYGIKYEPAGEPSKISMPDKSVLEKRADGWYNGDKKQFDSVTVNKENNSITFKKADGSSELVDSKGTKHQYDAKGQEVASEGADGTKTTFKRNEQGEYQGKETRSADGKTLTQYDNNDRVMQVDRDGQRVSVERDAKGNITKINDSLGPNSFESSDGGKTFKQAGTGIKIDGTPSLKPNGDYEFRSANKVLTRTKDSITVQSGDEKTVLNNDGTSVSFNKAGEVEQSSTADGVRLAVKTEKDASKPDAPAKVTEARIGDQVWTRSKEPGKEDVWNSNNGLQRKGEFSMDKSGNMHFVDAASKSELVHNIDGSTVERDAKSNIRSTTSPEGKTTSYSYDANNKLTGIKMPDGTSFSRLPDRIDDKKQPHERWAQDGTSKIIEGSRTLDKEGTLRIKNEGGPETAVRRDGWQEKQGEGGQKLLTKENPDRSTLTKNEQGQIVETKTTDGQLRKFEYDAKGSLAKIDMGPEGKLSTTDGGKTWTKDGSNPPETRTANFSLTPAGDLVEQKKVNGTAVEDIRKTDGSTLHAEGGRYTNLKIGNQEYKVGYDDKKQPNRFEDPKDKGAYWSSSDNKTWTKHNADGTEDKATAPQKFSVGFDAQGNLLKQNHEKSPSTIDRTSTDGSTATISADGRKLSEKIPDGKGNFTETNFNYDAQNKFTGKETKSPDGTVLKSDAFGRTTEVSKGPFKRSFAYENEQYPQLVTSFNDNGNKYALDKTALEKGQVIYKNEDPAKANDIRPGMFNVGKDGSLSMKGENGFELTDRLDKTKLVKNTDGSMIEYRPDGLISSTRDANGFLRSYKYDLPNNRDILGRPDRLSEVTYGEGPGASTYRTYDGFNWTQDGTGKQWKGFTSVDQSTGTLTDKHYYGGVAEYGLDGQKRERTDKKIASNADEIRKTIDYWYNSNAIKDIRAQLADLDAEQTHMLKHVYQDRTGHGLWGDLYKRFDEGSDTHRWAEVQGYLNRKGNPGEDKAIQLAVNAEESSRWFWNRDRSQSEIAASTRNILGNATEKERQNYVDAFHNIYNKDLKAQFQPGGSGSGIMERDAYTKAVLSISLEKGKDIRTAEEEGKILDAALSGGRKLDYFQEATSLVKDSGREAWTKNGGAEKITAAFTTTRSDEGGNTWEEVDRFAVQQATDFAETGALRPHTQIQKAAGVFSNDDNVIDHTLNSLKPEQRAQFADGSKLAKASPEEQAKFTPKEQEALKFYNNMMDSFKSLHYFGVDRKVEKYIDQTLHKGGTDVAAKVAPIGGHWFNSNQVNAQAIESMDQKTFNQLLSGSRGTPGADNSITGGIQGDKRQYASEFHKQMDTALEKNLGGGEYIDKARKLLDEKVAKGLSINESADKGDFDALRQKVPAFGNVPEAQYKEIGAGYRLQQDLASGKIKDSDLTGDQRKQLEAYQKDNVVRPFMEGREVARKLNDIETGARADRLFEGQRLEKELAGKTPTPEQQAKIDFFKQNAKEIEGLTPALKNQAIEKQRESFNKQLSEPGSKALEAYQKGIYDAVRQTTGRSLETKLKDNESFWGNDRKAMVDAVLNMKAEDRKLLASQTPEGEAARKALRDQFKEKFSNGAEDNARYKLIDSLLKQVETSKDAVPAAPVMGAKEQLLAKAAGLDGYSDKSATKLITDAIKADKDGTESRKLAEDPEFKKAAIEAFKKENSTGDDAADTAAAEKAFNDQVKPLLETGRMTSDALKEKHTSYDPESGVPFFNSRGYFKEGVLDASPRALAYLNSPEGAAEKAKMLETLKKEGPKEVYELAQNILKQGEVKPEDKLRAFALNAGVTKEEAINLMKSMTEEGPRVEIQNRYEAKYENFRASMLKQVDNKEYDEVFRATRHKDWSQDKEHLHAIKIVTSTDAGLGARLASNYNTTHVEALNDFNRKIYEATSQGKTLDVNTLNALAANTEDRVKSFKETKQSTTDTVVTGAVTGISLVAAPFTAGASLYALAGISTVMGLGAATAKYALMGNDTNGAKEFAGDTFKYTALAFSNQFGAGNLGFKEATHLAGASTMQILKTEATNLLVHSTVGGIGNTIGEGGRQLIDEGHIDGKSLQIAFAQGFVFTGVISSVLKGGGMLFKGAEHPNVPIPKAEGITEVAVGTTGLAAVTADAARTHVPQAAPQLHPGAGTTAAEELKGVFGKAKTGDAPVLPKDAPAGGVKDVPATGSKDVPATGSKDVPATGSKDVPATGSKDVPATGSKDVPEGQLPKDATGKVPVDPEGRPIDIRESLVNRVSSNETQLVRSPEPFKPYGAGDFKLDVDGISMPVESNVFTLGRKAGNDGVFSNITVSGNHAKIEITPGGPIIRDVGSSNGTFVNGQRIPAGQDIPIKPGDVIRLGPVTEFKFGVKPEFHLSVKGQGVDLAAEGVTTLGRNPANNVQINEGSVSRYHAEIKQTESGPVIIDKNSTYGTFVNGERIPAGQEVHLKPGDSIKLGNDPTVYRLGKGTEGLAVKAPEAPRQVLEYKVKAGEVDHAANPEAVKSSNKYKAQGEVREPLRDGFQTLSGDRPINSDGKFSDPHRPSVIVDRTKDSVLRDTIAEAHARFDQFKNDPKRLAEELTRFSKEKMHPKGWSEEMVDAAYHSFRSENKGKQILLGDYIERAGRHEGAGVCQHQALLNKVLGDEFGLDVSLVSGYYGRAQKGTLPKDTFANHAWNEYHIDGKTYVFDPRHEAIMKTAEQMPNHHPSREWISGPDAKPVGRFGSAELKPGDKVNLNDRPGWKVTTEKPSEPGNVVLRNSAAKDATLEQVRQLNGDRKLVVGESFKLQRSNGAIEDGWKLAGQSDNGHLLFFKEDGMRVEASLKDLARENPHIGEIRADKIIDSPTVPRSEVKPGEYLDYPKLQQLSKEIAEQFREAPLSLEKFEQIFSKIPEADRKLALEIMEHSAPNLNSRVLDEQLKKLGSQMESGKVTIYTMSPDSSDNPLAYLFRKNNPNMDVEIKVMTADELAKGPAQGQALVLGDLSKATAEQKAFLAKQSNLAVGELGGFDKGINLWDMGAAKYAGPELVEAKLKGLVDEAKKMAQVNPGMSMEEAVKKTIQGDTAASAKAINSEAKLLKAEIDNTNRMLRAEVADDTMDAVRDLYGDITKPMIDAGQIEKFLGSMDARQQAAAAMILRDGVTTKTYSTMMEEMKDLQQKILQRTGAKPEDLVIIHSADSNGSSYLINSLYSRVNGIQPNQFISMDKLGSIPKGSMKGKVLVYLDDIAYSGKQASDQMIINANAIQKSGAKVTVGSLGSFEVPPEKNFWTMHERSNAPEYQALKRLNPIIVPNESYKTFYAPDNKHGLLFQFGDDKAMFPQIGGKSDWSKSSVDSAVVLPYGGPNNNIDLLTRLLRDAKMPGTK